MRVRDEVAFVNDVVQKDRMEEEEDLFTDDIWKERVEEDELDLFTEDIWEQRVQDEVVVDNSIPRWKEPVAEMAKADKEGDSVVKTTEPNQRRWVKEVRALHHSTQYFPYRVRQWPGSPWEWRKDRPPRRVASMKK